MKFILSLTMLVSFNLVAQPVVSEESSPLNYRSKATDRFLVAGTAGIGLSSLGFLSEGYEVGGHTALELRARLISRCGPLVEWHRDSISYSSRHQSVSMDNSMWRVGAFCRLLEFEKFKFWRGSHLDVHGGIQYGRSIHHTYYDSESREQAAGRVNGFGAKLGTDFYFPGFFGLWTFGGLGLEANSFKYDLPEDPGGDGNPEPKQFYIFLRIGLGFSF